MAFPEEDGFDWRKAYGTGALALMLVPAVGTLLTPEVAWGVEDFAAMGAMLGVAFLLLEGVARATRTARARAVGVGLVALAFLVTWAELAVGIFA